MFVVQNVIFGFSSLPEHLFYQVNGSDFSCVRKDNALVIESFDGEVKAGFLTVSLLSIFIYIRKRKKFI